MARTPQSAAARMPLGAALLVLLASAGPAARAQDADPAGHHPEVRALLLSEFRYAPPAPAAAAQPAVLAQAAVAPGPANEPAAADIVRMEPYTVREGARMGAMHAAIEREHAKAATESRMAKLGVGIHDVHFAGIHLFAGTVFFIPFVVGVGDPVAGGAATVGRRPGAP